MSNVSNSNNGSNFAYIQQTLDDSHRAIRDLEAQKEDETDRLRKARNDDVARVEHDYQVILKDQKDDTDESIRQISDSFKKDLASEREISKGQYADVKRQVYDRYGKLVEADLSEGRDRLERAQESLALAAEGQRKSNATVDEAYQTKLRDIAEESNAKGVQAAERAREGAMEAYRNTYEGDKAEWVSQKKELQEKYGKLTQDVLEQLQSQRRQLEHAQKQTEMDYSHREEGLKKSSSGEIAALGEHFDRKTTNAILQQKHSYEDSSSQLRSQIRDLLELQREFTKGRSEGRQDSIKEFETDVRNRERMVTEAYETQLANEHEKAREQQIQSSERHAETVAEREKYFARLLRGVNQDSRDRQNDLMTQFHSANDQLKDQMIRDRELANKNVERMAENSAQQNDHAMKSQAESFQATLADQRMDLRSQIKSLEDKLREMQSSNDPTKITPAAEAAVRKSIITEYEKLKDAETAANQRRLESIRSEYKEAYDENLDHSRVRETELIHEKTALDDQNRAAFFNYANDIETNKNMALRTMESDHDREMQQLARNFSQSVMKQERATQESVNALVHSYENKLAGFRQESEFKNNMDHRKFNMEQTQLIKDYDRKMDEMRDEYELKLEDMRREVATSKVDVERRSRQVLEEQARAYEHQITQTRIQQEERDKTIAQNYEEKLEQMRHSHARLAQKKG